MLVGPIEFGEFSLDCDRYELLRAGRPIKLEKLPMELLILLAERDGHLVTRQEIVERLWGADVFLDTEHGINTAIRKVRTVLRDDPEQPRFVQTVSGKGYRFIAPTITRGNGAEPAVVGEPSAVPEPDVRASKPLSLIRRSWLSSLVLLAGIGLAAILIGMNMGGVLDRWFARSTKPHIHSLAVLPLENLSGDPAQDYFADGMTDELITMLAKNPGLRVISRTSAMQYKSAHRWLPAIAHELGVDGILEGSVGRFGNRVHINVQLVYALNDSHIWAESYDRDLNEVGSLQSELAQTIAGQVGLTVSSPAGPERRIGPVAHDAYLRARHFANIRGPALTKALEYYQQATAKEPSFALAYAGLAESQWRNGDFVAAKISANKALQIDATMGEPLATLAQIKAYNDWDFPGAEEDFKRAIAVSPNYPTARQWYAQFLHWMGRLDEAMAQIQAGQQLDPLSLIMGADRAEILLHMGQLDAATMQIKRVLELNSEFPPGHFVLAEIYERQGKYDDAIAEYGMSGAKPNDPCTLAFQAMIYAEAGRKEKARQILHRAEKISTQASLQDNGVPIASAYAALGDKDRAFVWLERAYMVRSPDLITLKMPENLGPLRTDRRFANLLKRVGLP